MTIDRSPGPVTHDPMAYNRERENATAMTESMWMGRSTRQDSVNKNASIKLLPVSEESSSRPLQHSKKIKDRTVTRLTDAQLHTLMENKAIKPDADGYRTLQHLGSGSFGSADAVLKGSEGALVVRKTMAADENNQHEINLLQSLNHKNIVSVQSSWGDDVQNDQQLYLVMSHGGSPLSKLIDNGIRVNNTGEDDPADAIRLHQDGPKVQPLPLSLVRKISKQLFEAVAYLHENGIAHRDIKPDNLLINAAGELSVCDFGLAASLPPGEQAKEIAGTVEFMAPEMLDLLEKKSTAGTGTAVDSWAIGCILYELLCGEGLFDNDKDTEQEFVSEMRSQQLDPSGRAGKRGLLGLYHHKLINNQQLSALHELLDGLLQVDPEKRMSTADALKSSFFAPPDSSANEEGTQL